MLPRHILFGFDPNESKTFSPVFMYLINVMKFVIWTARNDFRFRQVQPSAVGVLESLKARIRFYLSTYFKTLVSHKAKAKFIRLWSADGSIFQYTNNGLKFFI